MEALSGATTPGQSGPGSDGNEGVFRIPKTSSVTGTSPSDCLVLYPGHSLRESYPSAEMQSAYSTAPTDWTMRLKRKADSQMTIYTLRSRGLSTLVKELTAFSHVMQSSSNESKTPESISAKCKQTKANT